ncbi:MAG: alcohol dehydrogenase catalytic domain-containing protein, partial [Deinococcus sp.]|nr:alcohol dehydrogenase catalytic domain-containing protein [Deinococcus sp.]
MKAKVPAQMPAAVFQGQGKLAVEKRPVPKINSDQDVLLAVDASSFCGTDLQILKVPPGHPATPGAVLGHEYTGVIVDAGDAVQDFKVGDRVVVDPNLTCSKCRYCQRG